jgi:hypothetical protein
MNKDGVIVGMMPKVVLLNEFKRKESAAVYFTKNELNQLLSHYSRRVISGEWKDYAIDHSKGMSAFSIYRETGTHPVFTISKYAKGTHRNGDYVVGTAGNTLKRGKDLSEVLSIFKRQLKLVSR